MVNSSILSWTVPERLESCIINYLYTYENTGKSGFLNINSNAISLYDLNVTTACEESTIVIAPVVNISHSVMILSNSSGRAELCQPETTASEFSRCMNLCMLFIFKIRDLVPGGIYPSIN